MHKVKELIGKSIVHQTTGAYVARVYDVVFDANVRKVSALLISSGGWFADAQVVPWSRVRGVGDVIMVDGEHPVISRADAPELAEQGISEGKVSGTTIVTDTGERLGTVGDLFIDKAGAVVGFEVKQGVMSLAARKFLPADQVQAVGSTVVIAHASEETLEPIDKVKTMQEQQPGSAA